MAKRTVTFTIEETLIEKFDKYCKKNQHNKSQVVESQLEKWLKEKKGK